MGNLPKVAWILLILVFFAVVSGIHDLATANRRAHQQKVEQVTREANERIARDRVADDHRKAAAAFRETHPSKPNAGEVALILCQRLRQIGATTCDTHFNVWSSSYIDATFAVDPSQAQAICGAAVKLTSGLDHVMLGWSLKLFSPLGQDRPMAACNL